MDERELEEQRQAVRELMQEAWRDALRREATQEMVKRSFMAGLRGDPEPPAEP